MSARPASVERTGLADFRRVKPLLFGVASEVHPERWRAVGLTPDAGDRLAKCPRSRAALSRDLSWAGNAAAVGDDWKECFDALRTAPGEWALLPGAELWRRSLLFGAGCFRSEIAKLIFRADVDAFRRTAGEEAHSFALRTAPMLWRAAAPLSGLPDAESVEDRVVAAAGLALGCWLAGLPAGLAARAAVKLPLSCDADADTAAGWPEERRRAWMGLFTGVFQWG